jgi:hypothetical protein
MAGSSVGSSARNARANSGRSHHGWYGNEHCTGDHHRHACGRGGMICPHPQCTGVHDNNRYHDLCPRSLELKRDKDQRYERTPARYLWKYGRGLVRQSLGIVGRMADMGASKGYIAEELDYWEKARKALADQAARSNPAIPMVTGDCPCNRPSDVRGVSRCFHCPQRFTDSAEMETHKAGHHAYAHTGAHAGT